MRRLDWLHGIPLSAGCFNKNKKTLTAHSRNSAPHFGPEVSLTDLGNVGRVPVDRFTLFGKLGANQAHS